MAEAVKEYDGAIDKGLEGVVACTHRDQHDRRHDAHLPRLHHRGSRRATRPSKRSSTCSGTGGSLRRKELADFESALHQKMALPPRSFGWFHGLPTNVHPMDFLHAVVAGLSLHDPDANVMSDEADAAQVDPPDGALGTIIAAYHRVRSGQWPLQPQPGQGRSPGTSSTCSSARSPSPERVEQFDTCLILHADHELNASAFSARVTSSTESGIYSSIMAAIGTLKGPLHGGANEQVMRDAARDRHAWTRSSRS